MYQDAAQVPGANIPDLHLDLTVYSPQPDQRFVFLNMMKLHEGDALPTGVRVEQITRDGVILSYRGTRFIMEASP
jgi:general secretion pathway protein B